MNGITNPHRHLVNQYYHGLINFYKLPAYKLIRHLQKKYNCPLEEIGYVMGMSKQAVKIQYINKFLKENRTELDSSV